MLKDLFKLLGLQNLAIIGGVTVLTLGGTYACGDHNGAERITARHAKAEREVVERAAKASDKAAEQRATDQAQVSAAQEARHDAINAVPDERPSGPELALACVRLEAQGGRLPAVCGAGSPR